MEHKLLSTALALLVSYVFLRYILRKSLRDKDGNSIPPGPPFRFPFLPRYPEHIIHKWAKKYGPIYSVWMGNQLFVVLNDPTVVRDLLVVNGANFSSRWNYFMKNQTILKGGAITATPYNETWRKHRRIANTMLSSKAVEGYTAALDYEAHMLIHSLYHDTEQGKASVDPAHYVGRYVLNNMLSVTFGTRTGSVTDPLVKRALLLGMEFMRLTASAMDTDPTRSRGRKLSQDFLDVYGAMIRHVKERMDSDDDVPDCLVKSLLACEEEEHLSWTDLCMLTTAFATGGSHSTSGTIHWFLALMPSHPEIQAKAHQELDHVIGRARWPSPEDESCLPYVRAIVKEVLRCHSPFWMGTPHCSDNDFVYRGMYIPANTVMVLNCYSLHQNEERYAEALEFNPDRFMGDNLSSTESSKLANPMDRDHWAFGAGRRICPGMLVAEKELFLAVSRLLWAFCIAAVPGKPPCLEEYDGNSGRTPLPFEVGAVLDTLKEEEMPTGLVYTDDIDFRLA
ncbi:cytochrome P450 [Fomitopsis serialis]|uniref:cytochrome P450 n=1 Tax=Fomitopsis serialis TaxID=139415 RepID=UPI002008BE07|nr:cytochrome P450 [Neoantrodia serialis]KAH9922938.1 cytochrome P450 [Neoantrodia serialis]